VERSGILPAGRNRVGAMGSHRIERLKAVGDVAKRLTNTIVTCAALLTAYRRRGRRTSYRLPRFNRDPTHGPD